MNNVKKVTGFMLAVLAIVLTPPAIAQETADSDRPPVLIDDNGNTNQLIVRLDLDDNTVTQRITGSLEFFSSRSLAEEAVVDAVNSRVPAAMSYFAEPVEAWHLVSEERLDDVALEFLGDDCPEERLHQSRVHAELRERLARLRVSKQHWWRPHHSVMADHFEDQ